jgi:hypothetical protein
MTSLQRSAPAHRDDFTSPFIGMAPEPPSIAAVPWAMWTTACRPANCPAVHHDPTLNQKAG